MAAAGRQRGGAGGVGHDNEREDKGDRERGGRDAGILPNRRGHPHHDRRMAAGHSTRLGQHAEVQPALAHRGENHLAAWAIAHATSGASRNFTRLP